MEQLLAPQSLLCALDCPDHIERAAQRYVKQLIARAPSSPGTGADTASSDQVAQVAQADSVGAGKTAPPRGILRISVIVDACFRLIVDGESASLWRRWGGAQELG